MDRTITNATWTLKWHSRHQKWIVENVAGKRWFFGTKEQAETWIEQNRLTVVFWERKTARVESAKTSRRRARRRIYGTTATSVTRDDLELQP